MPYDHRVDVGRRVIYVRGHGSVEIEATLDSIRRLPTEPGFEPDFLVLVDLRKSGWIPEVEEIRRIADEFAGLSKRFQNRIALLAEREVDFGIARMASSFVEARGIQMAAFKDRSDAERWLGVELDDLVEPSAEAATSR